MEQKTNTNQEVRDTRDQRGNRGPRPSRMANMQRIDEFKDQVIDLRRVTRVTKGGKRMRFRATIVIGNGKGKVAVGIAKGADVMEAISKAKFQAKKNVIEVKMAGKTIPHKVEAKFSSAVIMIKPAASGHGLMAGGAPRVVLTMAGIQDVTAKTISRTPNKLTNAIATIEALKKLKDPKPSKEKSKDNPAGQAEAKHSESRNESSAPAREKKNK